MKTSPKKDRNEADPKTRPAPAEQGRPPRLPAVRTNLRAGLVGDPCEGGEIKHK